MTETRPPWYHGKMSADRATKICVKIGKNGAFLVRRSEAVHGAFTVSLFFDREVYHHRIIRKSKNHYHMEATGRHFSSLEELVACYAKKQQEFIYPLTIPVDKSRVQQMDEEDETWQTNIVVDSTLYQPVWSSSNKNLPQNFSPTPYPIPESHYSYEEVIPLEHKDSPTIPRKLPDCPSPPSPPPPPPAQSYPAVSDEEEQDHWPAPPPSIAKRTPPKVLPRPCPKTKNRSGRPQSCSVLPSAHATSFGGLQESEFESRSAVRPQSGFDFPSAETTPIGMLQATEPENPSATKMGVPKTKSFELHDQGYDTGRLRRRRTSSFEEISNFKKTNNRNKQATTMSHHGLQRSNTTIVQTTTDVSSEKADKHGLKKSTGKSPFKRLTDLLRKKKSQQKEMDSEFHIPILCKTKFVAVADYFGQEGAMEFKKGTEMVIRGVRTDGWWYCYNKMNKETGWVLQDYLKPKSNDEWFEAKCVETARDQQVYEKIDDDDSDSDFEDDVNYCKYLLPVDGVNPDDQRTTSDVFGDNN